MVVVYSTSVAAKAPASQLTSQPADQPASQRRLIPTIY